MANIRHVLRTFSGLDPSKVKLLLDLLIVAVSKQYAVSRISQTGVERQPLRFGRQPIIWQDFLVKTAFKRQKLDQGALIPSAPSLEPPMEKFKMSWLNGCTLWYIWNSCLKGNTRGEWSSIYDVMLVISNGQSYCYHLPTKLWEGNVFFWVMSSLVSHSVHRGGGSPMWLLAIFLLTSPYRSPPDMGHVQLLNLNVTVQRPPSLWHVQICSLWSRNGCQVDGSKPTGLLSCFVIWMFNGLLAKDLWHHYCTFWGPLH